MARTSGARQHSADRLRLLRFFSTVGLAASTVASCALPSLTDYANGQAGAAGSGDAGGNPNAGDGSNSSGQTSRGGGGANVGGAGGVATGGAGSGGVTSIGQAGEAGAACVPEICNGADDDCNQVVDNGCPGSFLRGAATAGDVIGDVTGGSAFSETCANDELVVGLQVAFSNWLDQVTVKCQQFSLSVDKKSTPYQYSVGFGASHLLNTHPPTTNDSLQTLNCPSGKVLVGLAIAEQHTSPAFTPDYLVVTQISATCADLVLNLSAATPALEWQNPTDIGPLSGTLYAAASAMPQTVTLTSDQIAVGYHGSSGVWVDRMGPIVSTVQVVLQ
jgi:hypothetical protein